MKKTRSEKSRNTVPLRPFQIFLKIHGDICNSWCTTGINDNGGKFAIYRQQICHWYQQQRWQIFPPVSLVLLITVANLPPVSTIRAVDTGGKFATGVNDASGKLPPVSTTPAANLSQA
jgi:hypothetical protein